MPEHSEPHFRIRLILAAVAGWPAAFLILAGFIVPLFDPSWGHRIVAFGSGLLTVALEIDPTAKSPWWLKALLALFAALGALFAS